MPDNQFRTVPEEIWLSTWAELEEVVIGGGSSRDIVPSSRPDGHRASHWIVSNEAVVFLKAVVRLAYLRAGLIWRGPQTNAVARFLIKNEFPVVRDKNLKEGMQIPDPISIMGKHVPLKAPNYEDVRRLSRPEQARFRAKLIKTYKKCAISGCEVKEVLEACHIRSHEVGGPAIPSNGVLLRRDLHRLFDLGLVALDPKTRLWKFHDDASDHYRDLIDHLGQSAFRADDPRMTALEEHWSLSQLEKK